MKKVLRSLLPVALVAGSLALIPACRESTGLNRPVVRVPPGEEFTLQVGQSRIVDDLNVEIGFDRVTGDSRCARDVFCIWEGAAGLRMWLRPQAANRVAFDLEMPGLTERANVSRVVAGYRVSLFALAPYPASGVVIPPKAYRATLSVSAAN